MKTFGADAMVDNPDAIPFEARGILERIQNNPEDYKRFYHNNPPRSAPIYKKPHIFSDGSILRFSRICDHHDWLSPVLLGDEAMIAPVYTQNVSGRTVYLPEEMKFSFPSCIVSRPSFISSSINLIKV